MCGCGIKPVRPLGLTPRLTTLVGSTAQHLTLKPGRVYELRTTADVFVRTDGQEPTDVDFRLRPDTPRTFTADTGTVSLRNATGTDANVFLFSEVNL